MSRRKYGKVMSDPIDSLVQNKWTDSITFVDHSNEAAAKTRVAACMYIKRHGYDLTTSVRENEITILKNKDVIGMNYKVDL